MAEITGDNSAVMSAAMAARQADANIKMMRLRRDVTGAYETLVNSIVRVIDYYNSKNRDASIDNIIITGIAADFWGFADLLSSMLDRNVEVLRNMAGTAVDQGLHLQDVSLGDYITVIGAGLSTVGFMPTVETGAKDGKGKGKAKSSANTSQIGIILMVAGVIGIIVVGVMYIPKYVMANSTNERLKEQKAQLEPVQDTYNEYMRVKNDYEYLTAVYGQTQNYNTDMREMFSMFEKVLPASTQVTNLTAESDTLSMTMRVGNKKEAASTLIALREYENFSDVTLTSIQVESEEEDSVVREYVEFTVICTYGFNPNLEAEQEEEAQTEEGAPADEAADTEQ